ncbi:hypothetical protein BI355_1570 [Companilactobacillus crustorum]|nr:hypothetical protein BI355_1570 [Companilactobacillus crustorum]
MVTNTGYGSEMNYQFITDELNTNYLIPYDIYEKELARTYHKDKRRLPIGNTSKIRLKNSFQVKLVNQSMHSVGLILNQSLQT